MKSDNIRIRSSYGLRGAVLDVELPSGRTISRHYQTMSPAKSSEPFQRQAAAMVAVLSAERLGCQIEILVDDLRDRVSLATYIGEHAGILGVRCRLVAEATPQA